MPLNDENKIYCIIRKKWVTCQPEEKVRQQILHYLIKNLHYPSEIIAVEVALKELPHLATNQIKLPPRRVDILCYGSNLKPQLLIECKAVPLNDTMLTQMMGYNHYVQASYVSIANHREIWTAHIDKDKSSYQLFKGFPIYPKFGET